MKTNKIYLPLTITLLFFGVAIIFNFQIKGEQQFSYLADALLQGKLYFLERPLTWFDSVYKDGHYYWPLGPFPAILLIPFTLIIKTLGGTYFYQGWLQFPLTVGTFFLIAKIARKYGFNITDAVFLSFAFIFSTVYHLVAVIPWSWYFSHAVAVFLTFLALYEFKTKQRFYIIGILMGFVFMTRLTAGITSLFFLLHILFNSKWNLRKKVAKSCYLVLPIVLLGIFLMFLNFVRFDHPLDSGYTQVNNVILSEADRFELLNYGLFQLRNIPTNFYYYFIKSLDPILVEFKSYTGNTYVLKAPYLKVGFPGTSFFIVSPIFLYIFKAKFTKEVKFALVPILITLFLLLTYFWPGWRQTGPRYTLDFLPLATLILFAAFEDRKLPLLTKSGIIVSSFFNLYLLLLLFSS